MEPSGWWNCAGMRTCGSTSASRRDLPLKCGRRHSRRSPRADLAAHGRTHGMITARMELLARSSATTAAKQGPVAMRIVVVIASLGPGGAERVAVHLAAGLSDCGHQVMVVTLADVPCDHYTLTAACRRESLGGFRPGRGLAGACTVPAPASRASAIPAREGGCVSWTRPMRRRCGRGEDGDTRRCSRAWRPRGVARFPSVAVLRRLT